MVALQNYFYVPWSDDLEWSKVGYNLACGDIKSLKLAYEVIQMWKLKYHALPTYVESTFSFLQVSIKEYEMRAINNFVLSASDEHDLQLSYSTALIRFVNHVSSLWGRGDESLYLSAKNQNIPDWIINMRHEAAHSQNLPSLDSLHAALEISLRWLLDNYWTKKLATQKESVSINNSLSLIGDEGISVTKYFEKFLLIWNFLIERREIYLGEIKSEFLCHFEELFELSNPHFNIVLKYNNFGLQTLISSYKSMENGSINYKETPTIKNIKRFFLYVLQTTLKKTNYGKLFITALLKSPFLTGNHLKIKKWKKIIEIIQRFGFLDVFIENLFEMAAEENLKASKLLIILYPSIKLLEKKCIMFKVHRKENRNLALKKIKKQLKSLKDDKHRSVVNFYVGKPPVLNLEVVSKILLNPEARYLKGLVFYLKFIKPTIPESTFHLIRTLIYNYHAVNINKCDRNEVNDKIFTVEDIELGIEKNHSMTKEAIESNEFNEGWQKSEIGIQEWSKSPLGLLPYQSAVNCNLPNDLVWSVETA